MGIARYCQVLAGIVGYRMKYLPIPQDILENFGIPVRLLGIAAF